MRKVQSFVPIDSELEVQRLKRAGQDVVEEPAKRQRIGEALGSVQEQTGEESKAEELSQEQLHQMMMVIPVEEVYVEALQKFNRDDLDKLWNLVKERFRTTEPTKDKARELWVELKRGHDIYILVEKDYPLTKALVTLMLCNKLRVDQYSDMAEELLKKIFILVERPRHLEEDCWELNVYTLSPAKPILNAAQDITNSTNHQWKSGWCSRHDHKRFELEDIDQDHDEGLFRVILPGGKNYARKRVVRSSQVKMDLVNGIYNPEKVLKMLDQVFRHKSVECTSVLHQSDGVGSQGGYLGSFGKLNGVSIALVARSGVIS
ncbi:hypothetical protein Tco_0891633 [Tanacetum coccineum]|uniref:Uncharacterized protein n=1 Tax=Tanacetum coccineum TaxID=301880 RepID=A0ABQ5C3I0_9ASTR